MGKVIKKVKNYVYKILIDVNVVFVLVEVFFVLGIVVVKGVKISKWIKNLKKIVFFCFVNVKLIKLKLIKSMWYVFMVNGK